VQPLAIMPDPIGHLLLKINRLPESHHFKNYTSRIPLSRERRAGTFIYPNIKIRQA